MFRQLKPGQPLNVQRGDFRAAKNEDALCGDCVRKATADVGIVKEAADNEVQTGSQEGVGPKA